jgi:hypothetical protein
MTALTAAEAEVHAERWQCIKIRSRCCLRRRGRDFLPCEELQITARGAAVRLGFGFVWVIAGCRAELADLACRAAARSGEGGAVPRRYIALDRHQLNRDVAGRLPTGIVLPAAGPAVRSRAFCSRFLRIVAALPAPWHSLAIGVAGAARRPGQSPLAPWCAVVCRRCLS